MAFSWLNFGQAKAELANRLNDTVFVSPTEAGLYIVLAIRIWQCYTQFWLAEYALTLTPPFAANWFQANGSGSPRAQTQTDVTLYTLMEYLLLEPPTGGTWTGTAQFSIADLAQAVQGRRDESTQIGATNVAEVALPVTANTNRVILTDNALDVLRVRYVPVQGSPVVLERGDAETFRTFTPSWLQTVAAPARYDIISGPPLALTLDSSVPTPGTMQTLIVQAEAVPTPPSATPLGIPDDYSWVPMFGALADLMGSQEESLDAARAKYADERYREGLKMLRAAPWLLEARINGVPVGISPVRAADRFNYGWQANAAAFPQVIEGGVDLFAVSPVPTAATSVLMVVVGNAPIPASDTAEIQVPRDVMDAILDEAEHLAQFKRGAFELQQSAERHKSFLETAKRWDNRVRLQGPLATTLRSSRGEPRFATTEKGKGGV